MITSSNNNRTWSDLHANQAALIYLMRLQPVWQEQVFNLCVVTDHEAVLTALTHIKKTEKHNPRWRLNRNWEILHSINYNQDTHNLEWNLCCDTKLLHLAALNTANSRILEYEATHPNLAARRQPTISYRLAYLRHGGTIINKRYDEEIAHHHNWEKFTKHCCEKFLWSTHTFSSVNWKAFQHWGKTGHQQADTSS
jgi:hypothetical protein